MKEPLRKSNHLIMLTTRETVINVYSPYNVHDRSRVSTRPNVCDYRVEMFLGLYL